VPENRPNYTPLSTNPEQRRKSASTKSSHKNHLRGTLKQGLETSHIIEIMFKGDDER
jgi:hypothetical protein